MARAIGSQLDLLKIPVKGFAVESNSVAPSAPVNGQLWFDTTANQLKVWITSAWVQCDNVVGGTASNVTDGDKGAITVTGGVWALDASTVTTTNLVDGTVGTIDLAPNAVTGPKLASGAVDNVNIVAGAVTSTSIADGTIALADLNGASIRLDTIAAPTGPVSLNTQKITGLLDPTSTQDAATKAYVDSVAQGLDAKQSVAAATTGPITLSGTQTVDGIALNAGDRCLVKDQSPGGTNGIYDVASGAWTRSADMNLPAETSNAYVWIEFGTVNADTGWVQIAGIATMGTSPMTWVQFAGAGSVNAGTGMTQSGNTLNVIAGDTSLSVIADSMSVALVPNSSMQVGASGLSVRTEATGGLTTNTSGLAALLKAGGGLSKDATGLFVDTTLIAKKFAGLVGALSAGVETLVTHSLGTQDVIASFRDASTNKVIEFDWRCASTTQIGITADIAYAANAIRATVVG